MANYGRPHTNNSQFFITAVDSTHLDGSNVVFGRILRGFGVIVEMERFADDDAIPFAVSGEPINLFRTHIKFDFLNLLYKDIRITDCGEIMKVEDWNYCDNDETADKLPPFPADWDSRDEKRGVLYHFDRYKKKPNFIQNLSIYWFVFHLLLFR